ncbi:MAG TPA: Sua5/YciO/YrdC/YwlC family protein, partial [Phycisphaeraceae bacterium]
MTDRMQVALVQPNDLKQAQAVAEQAAAVLKEGGLVVFPTETVYGVGASAASDRGVQALRDLKSQGEPRAFAIHLPDPMAAERYVDWSNPPLRRLVRKVFPGPVTLVVDVPEEVIAQKLRLLGLPPHCRDRLYRGGTVTLRCPDHGLTQQILGAIDAPVIAGAASLPGRRAPRDAAEALENLEGRVDLVIDGGRSRYAKPSTVVRVSGQGAHSTIRVEREGVYDERFMRKLMRWTMLLICSGNTCRSPMAQAIARRMLAEQRGIAEEDLPAAGIRVLSAGVGAIPGMPANPHAVEAMAKQGIDLTS